MKYFGYIDDVKQPRGSVMARNKKSLRNSATYAKMPTKRVRKTRVLVQHTEFVQLESGEVIDDAFLDKFCAINRKEFDKYVKQSTSSKADQIKNWLTRIEEVRNLIEQVNEDAAQTIDDKRKKINHYLGIINNHKNSIARNIEYLKYRSEKDALLFAEMGRMK